MIKDQQAGQYLEQLKLLYPAAFKHNYIFYGLIKTKGMLDDLKELIPWVLAGMIFISLSISLGAQLESLFPHLSEFRASGLAVLAIMLFFMLVTPLIIKQMKHSSASLYKQLRHTPIKLAALIVLQALNIAYIESALFQSLLFFFALSFGFVRFYKENLFREHSSSLQQHYLQETRRVCFWAYKQSLKLRCRLKFCTKDNLKHQFLQHKLKSMQSLHQQSMNFENQLCESFKHIDLDNYLDEMMK